jgi:hypothetical protein
MNDLRLHLVHHPSDAQHADGLKNDLESAIGAQGIDPAVTPEIELHPSFKDLPDVAAFGALSLVVVLLPDPNLVGFTEDERRALEQFRKDSFPDNRVIPVSIHPDRDRPPVPLHDIKSFPLHKDGAAKLATLLLNLLCLRQAGDDRKVFISYKVSDGTPWASGIADGLRQRGYTVWRDNDPDRDGLSMITPGMPAQKTIQEAIRQHGFILVIDTMEAPLSGWVHAEIETAISYMIPVMPVVIEDPIGSKNPKLQQVPKPGGGRFQPLRDLGREVRITNADQQKIPGGPSAMLGNPGFGFFDNLEKAMRDCLLAQLRTRRQLIHSAREGFKNRGLPLEPVLEDQLLYQASKSCDSPLSPGLTPGLSLRFLVQCAPYDALLPETLSNLCDHFKRQSPPNQYAVLVHQTALYPIDKKRLIQACGEHVMVLRSDEIDLLPSVFQF